MSGPYGMQHLKNQCCSNCKRKKLEDRVQFNVGSIDIELEVVAENETSVGAKINWWIFGGGMDAKAKDASKHKLKLMLEAVDASGKPLRVSRQQDERPK